jgi:hypothetical protein
MTAFATVSTLFVRLGRTTPAASDPAYKQAAAALEDASNQLRDIIGQNITAGTTTITETVPLGGLINMPVVPVRSIASVVDHDSGESISYSLENTKQLMVFGRENCRVDITCDYGWPTVPPVLANWSRVLAAASMLAADAGNLGLSGGLSGVGADDSRVSFATNVGEQGQGVSVPEGVAYQLRATYGSLTPTIEHRP